jgi:hypothetical protein
MMTGYSYSSFVLGCSPDILSVDARGRIYWILKLVLRAAGDNRPNYSLFLVLTKSYSLVMVQAGPPITVTFDATSNSIPSSVYIKFHTN